uniref:CUB domain-containing protein n=1 Tax=Echinostoma caproni TaxID=27848 RepID=A0A183B9B1_9TREM
LCLLRTLFRIEDMLRGYFDFTDAQVPCLGCHLSLQYEERYLDPHAILCEPVDLTSCRETASNTLFTSLPLNEKGEPQTLSFSFGTNGARITTWAELHLACLSKHLLPFTLPIPINATPQFCAQNASLLIDGRWRLRLEFILSPDTAWSALGSGPPGSSSYNSGENPVSDEWALSSYLRTEKLAWHLPIQLVSSDPSIVCMPQNTSTMPIILPVY